MCKELAYSNISPLIMSQLLHSLTNMVVLSGLRKGMAE
jgi:hypothetical protein